MKRLIYILLILPLVMFHSCRLEVPEDVFEHEEINKAELTLTDLISGETQVIIILNNGIADKKINLQNGKSYGADLRFYGNHEGETEDMTPEVIEEKDEHFITYEFSGVEIFMQRAAEDPVRSDGKKLGLRTIWNVQSQVATDSFVTIKLNHSADSVSDSASNGDQKGETQGGETDVLLKIFLQ